MNAYGRDFVLHLLLAHSCILPWVLLHTGAGANAALLTYGTYFFTDFHLLTLQVIAAYSASVLLKFTCKQLNLSLVLFVVLYIHWNLIITLFSGSIVISVYNRTAL